jgi:hypothetical protein
VSSLLAILETSEEGTLGLGESGRMARSDQQYGPDADYAPRWKLRNRLEFATTVTELNAIAAPAIMGDSNTPKNGYNTPAATGMPSAL